MVPKESGEFESMTGVLLKNIHLGGGLSFQLEEVARSGRENWRDGSDVLPCHS
jgi:hypothetical protein